MTDPKVEFVDDVLRVGSIVRLASGGPRMTVISLRPNEITVAWFVRRSKRLRTANFPRDGIFLMQNE